MLFPDFQRVVYQKPVLEEVVCQLRFPDILRISAEEPADFQEGIRFLYPQFNLQQPGLQAEGVPPELLDFVRRTLEKAPQRNAYDFSSEDQSSKVSLTSNFLALSTSDYRRWESFREALTLPFRHLCDVYRPSYFTRIGLRYRDVIVRSRLGMPDEPWSELLCPYVAGELASVDVFRNVKEKHASVVFELDNGAGFLRANHFLGTVVKTNEEVFVVDADFFYEGKVEINCAIEHLDTLNRYGGRFFRWCITDKLYKAMDPEPVE